MICRILMYLANWLDCAKSGELDTGASSLRFELISPAGNVLKVEKMDINFKGAGTETVRATGFKDANGNDTTEHGALVFTSSDDTIATVAEQGDGVTAIITGTGKVGTATITATDAQDNAVQMATVTTVPGEAVSFVLEAVLAAPVAAAVVDAAPVDAAAPVDPAAAAPADPAPVV